MFGILKNIYTNVSVINKSFDDISNKLCATSLQRSYNSKFMFLIVTKKLIKTLLRLKSLHREIQDQFIKALLICFSVTTGLGFRRFTKTREKPTK